MGSQYTDIQSTENDQFVTAASRDVLTAASHGLARIEAGCQWRNIPEPGAVQTDQSPYYFYSFSVMKSMFNKKLDISLNVQNFLSKMQKMTSTTTGTGFRQESINFQPMRNLGLSVTYRFGELKSSMRRVQRGIVNDDVMEGESNTQQTATGTVSGE